MGENKDSVTNFKLKFPATRDFILGDVDTIEQRQCLYIGECVEVLCFAKCNDVNTLKNETSLQKWSKQICSLQAFTTASAYLGEGIDIRTAENELDATVTPQNHMSNERNCRPFSAGMSEEVKVQVSIQSVDRSGGVPEVAGQITKTSRAIFWIFSGSMGVSQWDTVGVQDDGVTWKCHWRLQRVQNRNGFVEFGHWWPGFGQRRWEQEHWRHSFLQTHWWVLFLPLLHVWWGTESVRTMCWSFTVWL